MNNDPVFAFLGGDKRQVYMILSMAKDGYTVNIAGIDDMATVGRKNITLCRSAAQAVGNADFIVLPVPYTSAPGSDFINTPLSAHKIKLSELFCGEPSLKGKLILAGKADAGLYAAARLCGAEVADYMEREELAVLNAVPTAEGAIKLAMDELPFTVHGSYCLVTGFGRVAKILCRSLAALGADVSAAARKPADMAYMTAYGYKPININNVLNKENELKKFDIVFNTIPSRIIDDKFLRALRSDCLVIDLASKPGGVDLDAAGRLGRNVIWALSLPGKIAPLTAGNIIRAAISNIINEYEYKRI